MPIDTLQTLMMNQSFEIEIDSIKYYRINYSMSGFTMPPIPESRCHHTHLKGKYFEVCRVPDEYKYYGCPRELKKHSKYFYYSIEQFEKFLENLESEKDKFEINVLRMNWKWKAHPKHGDTRLFYIDERLKKCV